MEGLDKLAKVPLSRKIAVLVVFVFLIGVGFWFQFYTPVTEELDNLKTQYAQLEEQQNEARQRKATYDRDRRRRDELEKNFVQQIKALPADAQISAFLNKLSIQAELVGLEILSVKPTEEEAAEYFVRIPVELQMRGTFHQLSKFFYLVGNLDRIINIENISFEAEQADESSTILKSKVLATTFRSAQPGEAMAAGGAKGVRKRKGGQ
ncbi:MAG: type 4a pilus biogenesis protein PilO [Myxococcota bacterium]|jgi:type IV pilus assembly protein PilO|nr:type 4a pilus biogenesis protein PilO [Myxococcota bacterium]